jgi:hypothetical protein
LSSRSPCSNTSFGCNISIAGSVVLTLILTGVSMLVNRARA